MSTKETKVRIAALADLHFQASSTDSSFRDLFSEISKQADVLALCGDLTNSGQPEEARGLAREIKRCTVPVVGVLGNHDYHSGCIDEVKKILTDASLVLLDGQGHEACGVGFAGSKGFGGGFGDRMLSSFGEPAIKNFVSEAVNEAVKLESGLQALNSRHRVVLLHYSPIAETVQGESPEIHPFLGCSRLAETIDRFEVTAVFHGHAHHGTLEGKTAKGVPVYNCCMALARDRGRRPYTLIELQVLPSISGGSN